MAACLIKVMDLIGCRFFLPSRLPGVLLTSHGSLLLLGIDSPARSPPLRRHSFQLIHRLPSDSTLRWTLLPLAGHFTLSGRVRDLHPLEYVRTGRTLKKREKLIFPLPLNTFFTGNLYLFFVKTRPKSSVCIPGRSCKIVGTYC